MRVGCTLISDWRLQSAIKLACCLALLINWMFVRIVKEIGKHYETLGKAHCIQHVVNVLRYRFSKIDQKISSVLHLKYNYAPSGIIVA
jgi:hypothetical protein